VRREEEEDDPAFPAVPVVPVRREEEEEEEPEREEEPFLPTVFFALGGGALRAGGPFFRFKFAAGLGSGFTGGFTSSSSLLPSVESGWAPMGRWQVLQSMSLSRNRCSFPSSSFINRSIVMWQLILLLLVEEEATEVSIEREEWLLLLVVVGCCCWLLLLLVVVGGEGKQEDVSPRRTGRQSDVRQPFGED
jgi:hypothetical protein